MGRDDRLLGIAVDAVIRHVVHQRRARRERHVHPAHVGEHDPHLGAGPAHLGDVSVHVGEVGAEDRHLLDADMQPVGDGHRHAVVEIRLPEDRNSARRDLLDGIVVAVRHDIEMRLGSENRHVPALQRVHQLWTEVALLKQVVHPDDEIAAKGIGRHVDRPHFVDDAGVEFLGEAGREIVGDRRSHAQQNHALRLLGVRVQAPRGRYVAVAWVAPLLLRSRHLSSA